MRENQELADKLDRPSCQDTGVIQYFLQAGSNFPLLGELEDILLNATMGVTDVVRGADLLDSTPRQVALQRALDLHTPRYLHVPVAMRGGEKLSKQTLAPAIEAAQAVAALRSALAFLGQEPGRSAMANDLLGEAAARWDPAQIPHRRAVEAPPAP